MHVAYELQERRTVTLAEAVPAPVIAATTATAKAVPTVADLLRGASRQFWVDSQTT